MKTARAFIAHGTVLLLALAFLSFTTGIARAQRQSTNPEQTLFQSVNRERTARGLRPLRWDNALANAARQHAQRMAQQNQLSHQFSGEEDLSRRLVRAGARFSAAAENVAEGPDAAGLHTQWMNSAPHRENLLDPQLDSIGIAVEERNGEFFGVEDFTRAVADLSLDEQEHILSALLKSRGLHVLTDGGIVANTSANNFAGEARWSCSLDGGYAGKHKPAYMLRYTTADLGNLPDPLEQRIKSGRYHSAAVGACEPSGSDDFANYRVIVLLYE